MLRRVLALVVVVLAVAAVPSAAGAQEPHACAPRPGTDQRAAPYVCALYDRFLHPASADEVDYWMALFPAEVGGPYVDLSQVVLAVTDSQEARIHLVEELYEQYLGRRADSDGLFGWVFTFGLFGVRVEQVEAAMLGTDEYLARAGTVDGFVAALYDDVLGRNPSPADTAYWTGLVRDGTATREQVAAAVVTSPESDLRRATMLYGFLQRAPSAAEAAFWARQIDERGFLVARASFLGTEEAFRNLT